MSIRRPLQEDRTTAIPADAPPMYTAAPQQGGSQAAVAMSPRPGSINAGRFQVQQQQQQHATPPQQQMYAPPSGAPGPSASTSSRPTSMSSQSSQSQYQKPQQQQVNNPFQDPPSRPVSGVPVLGADLNRANSREDKLAICKYA